MYLLYIDESGPLGDPESGHVVIGGISVHETLVRPLNRRVESILAEHVDRHLLQVLEIHAQQIRTGKGSWRGVNPAARSDLLLALCAGISDFVLQHGSDMAACLAVVREPGAIPGQIPLEAQFERLLLNFQRMISESDDPGGSRTTREMGIVVADEAKYEAQIQPRVRAWQRSGTNVQGRRLTRLAEVPLFIDSRASRMTQVADLIAYVLFRSYEHSDGNLLDLLLPAFRTGEDGRIHGLMHLSGRRQMCECPACASRRDVVVPASGDTFGQGTLFPQDLGKIADGG